MNTPPLKPPKFKIYQGVICLELQSPHGRLWWAQGYGLGFTPFPLASVAGLRAGKLEESGRRVLAVRVPANGAMAWVAINAPRSDIPALEALGAWPTLWPKPYTAPPTYTPWPSTLYS